MLQGDGAGFSHIEPVELPIISDGLYTGYCQGILCPAQSGSLRPGSFGTFQVCGIGTFTRLGSSDPKLQPAHPRSGPLPPPQGSAREPGISLYIEGCSPAFSSFPVSETVFPETNRYTHTNTYTQTHLHEFRFPQKA